MSVSLSDGARQVIGEDVAARLSVDPDRPGEVVVASNSGARVSCVTASVSASSLPIRGESPFIAAACNHHRRTAPARDADPSACHPADPVDNAASASAHAAGGGRTGGTNDHGRSAGRQSRDATSSPISPDTWPISPTATTRSATATRSSSSSRSISTSGAAAVDRQQALFRRPVGVWAIHRPTASRRRRNLFRPRARRPIAARRDEPTSADNLAALIATRAAGPIAPPPARRAAVDLEGAGRRPGPPAPLPRNQRAVRTVEPHPQVPRRRQPAYAETLRLGLCPKEMAGRRRRRRRQHAQSRQRLPQGAEGEKWATSSVAVRAKRRSRPLRRRAGARREDRQELRATPLGAAIVSRVAARTRPTCCRSSRSRRPRPPRSPMRRRVR